MLSTEKIYLKCNKKNNRFIYSLSSHLDSSAQANYLLPRKAFLDDVIGLKVNRAIKRSMLELPKHLRESYMLFYWVNNNRLLSYKLIDEYLSVDNRKFTTSFYALDGSLMDERSIKKWMDNEALQDQIMKSRKDDQKPDLDTPMLAQSKLRSIRMPKFAYNLEYLFGKNIEKTLAKWHIKENKLSPIDFSDIKFFRIVKNSGYVRKEIARPLIENF